MVQALPTQLHLHHRAPRQHHHLPQESVVQVEEVVVTDVPQPDKTTTTVPVERDSQPQPYEPEKKKPVEETVTLETHLSKPNNIQIPATKSYQKNEK